MGEFSKNHISVKNASIVLKFGTRTHSPNIYQENQWGFARLRTADLGSPWI